MTQGRKKLNLRLGSNSEFQAFAWIPEHPTAAVICMHGAESHAKWFTSLAEYLTEADIAVYAFDRFGWGESAGQRGVFAGMRTTIAQITRLREAILSESFVTQNPQTPIYLLGMSWGGLFVLYLSLFRRVSFDRYALLVPGVFPLIKFSFFQRLRIVLSIFWRKTANVAFDWQPSDFTTKMSWQHFIKKDPLRIESVDGGFILASYYMQRCLKRAKFADQRQDIRVFLAGHDRIIDNAKTENFLKNANIGYDVMRGCSHTLCFEDGPKLASKLAEFFRS